MENGSGGRIACKPAVVYTYGVLVLVRRDVISDFLLVDAVGAELVLGGAGQWMVSTGTQTGERESQVQITVPLQQVV